MPLTKRDMLIGAASMAGTGAVIWKNYFPWLSDDLRTLRGFINVGRKQRKNFSANRMIIDAFEEYVHKHPEKPFIYFENKAYSYKYVDSMADRVANLVLSWNLKPGDVVAAMLQNEPAFIWTFLGLQKVGIVDAFINFHLADKPLLNSIKTSNAKALIIGSGEGLLENIREIDSQLQDLPKFVLGHIGENLPEGYQCMEELLQRTLPVGICKSVRKDVDWTSTACYIYTSGTTGLPKPVIINQTKCINSSTLWQLFDLRESDVVYVVTPLYHSGGTLLGFFNTLDVGASLVIRRKFSASQYWNDCRKYNVTVVHYVGELFRYLLKVPESPLDGKHSVRVAMGNGLRMDIWKKFQDRFKIPRIVEHFGATEGTSVTVNLSNRIGSIGRLSPFLSFLASHGWMAPTKVVRYNREEDQVVRDEKGRCVQCSAGDEGLIIAAVPLTTKRFYVGSDEINEKKYIRNVFVEGDEYFNFGDIVYIDNNYDLYFRDRLGDTFRWKGENVSTKEVAEVLCSLDFIQDVNVYGVTVPDHEGRAGMAAVILKSDVSQSPEIMSKIYRKCHHSLPSYARPLFLRFKKSLDITTTMKHKKAHLVKEGYDPDRVSDPLYFLDEQNKTYSPLNSITYQTISKSKL